MKKVALLSLVLLYLSIGYSQLQYTYEVAHVIDNTDASITVSVTNGSGVANYTYTWYDNTLTPIGTNSSLLSGLSQGVYFLKVEDALDPDTNNYIYTYFWVGKYGEVTTLSVQPNGMFGNDAVLRRIDKPGYGHVVNTNYGTYANLIPFYGTWSSLPNLGKGIIKFEYNGLSETTNSTTNLTLYGFHYRFIASTNPSVHNNVLIKRIKNGVSWSEHTVTYNSFYTNNTSVNVESTPVAEISSQGAVGSTVTAQYIKTVDISNIVEDQINQTHENNGMFYELKHNDKYRSQYFYGSDYVDDANKRPKLSITFTLPELITTFSPVRKQLDGSYVQVSADKQLRFIYEEEYTDQNLQLDYTVYDAKNIPVAFTENLIASYGSNKRVLDVNSLGSNGEIYTLEIKNDRGEKWYLKFRTP